jgi:hypothetical protein
MRHNEVGEREGKLGDMDEEKEEKVIQRIRYRQ